LASLTAVGRTDVIVVGYDATPEARTAISSGSLLVADAAQDPAEIGRRTVHAVAEYLRDGTARPVVAVPVGIVTRDSLH
jgi:ribose transport system substrate-binding protein